jgi:uncharacterized membrane protein YfhO
MKKIKSVATVSPPNIKDWHAILIITASVIIFFRDILLKNAFFWEDFLYQFYPFRNFAAVSMAHGELPLWNPYTFSGTPFQADIQSALFYIPNLLLTFFVGGDRLSYYWVELLVVAHIILAGVSMYYLAKDLGVDRVFALCSGLIYALSGFMITHAIHLVMIAQVAWLPLIVLLFRRSLRQKSWLYMIFAGLTLGHAVLAGFPQLSLYIFFFLLLYFLFEFFLHVRTNGIKSSLPLLVLAAGMVVIAVALTAIQLLPTIELAPLSQRAEIMYEKSQEGMLSWRQLVTSVVPKYFGSSGAQGSNYFGPGQYWVYWETCFYIGIPALIFVVFSVLLVKRNRYILFFLCISIFALLYALGENFILHKLFFNFVPGFNKFRSIGRMTLLFTFSTALMAGFGLKAIVELVQSKSSKFTKALLGLAIFGIFIVMIAQLGMLQPTKDQNSSQIHSIVMSEAVTSFILIIVTLIVLFLFNRRTVTSVVMIILLFAIQFVDMNIFGFEQNNGSINPDEYYNRTAQVVNILKKDGDSEYFRINARLGGAMLLDRNQGMVDRIFMMEGYTPLALQRVFPPAPDWSGVCDLLNAKYRILVDENQRQISMTSAATYTPRAYFVYNSQIITDEKQVKTAMEQSNFNPLQTVIFEEDPGFQTGNPSDKTHNNVRINSYNLNSISLNVSTTQNSFLVLSEIYYPGWNAYVDGRSQKVYRANWSLRAISIETGDHQVELRFEPKSFRRGLWITSATIGISLLGIVYSLRKKKRKNNQHESQSA